MKQLKLQLGTFQGKSTSLNSQDEEGLNDFLNQTLAPFNLASWQGAWPKCRIGNQFSRHPDIFWESYITRYFSSKFVSLREPQCKCSFYKWCLESARLFSGVWVRGGGKGGWNLISSPQLTSRASCQAAPFGNIFNSILFDLSFSI